MAGVMFAKRGEVWEHLQSEAVYFVLEPDGGRCFVLHDPNNWHANRQFVECDPNTVTYRRLA